ERVQRLLVLGLELGGRGSTGRRTLRAGDHRAEIKGDSHITNHILDHRNQHTPDDEDASGKSETRESAIKRMLTFMKAPSFCYPDNMSTNPTNQEALQREVAAELCR